ncbi:MAG: serine/threonine-protein kinase, partial [Aquihabitans sp.]
MVGRQPEVRGFELQEYIGRGGFSTVYRAMQPRLNRVVAVKVIDADIQADEDARRRFERECQTMGSLTGHHAVVTVHEVGECVDGQPYIAMELLEGGSLQDRLVADRNLPWPEVAAIGSQIAEALDAAHGLGILHRDVKPANIMRDRFDRHKLGDFGIAGLAASAHTTAGAAPATVAYAAPEVLLGKRASAASDVYGLGATLYALLTGGPAFAAETDESVVPMVMRITRDALPELDDAVAPPALRDLLASMMAKDPADRPANAAEVAAALKTVEAAHLLGETQARVPVGLAAAPASPAPVPAREPAPPSSSDDVTEEVVDATVLRVPKPVDRSPVVPVDGPDAAAEGGSTGRGEAPHASRRIRAVSVDLLILGALLTILAAVILPMGQPRANANITVSPDTVSVNYGQLRADDFGTTLTVENTSGRTIRLALRLNRDEGAAHPPGGATIADGQTRQFGLPRLAAGSYDIVLFTADGDVVSTFNASDGDGMLDVIEPRDTGIAAV